MSGLSSLISRLNLLKQIPVFKKLNWFELQKIARKSIISEYKKGDLISKEGSPPDFFYCLISGRLQAYTNAPDGIKENIDFIHRGMHFGIISVLTGEDHSMSFEAINDSVVLKISKDDFQAILKTIPHLGVELSEHLSRRIRRKVKGSKSIFESTVIAIYGPVKGAGSSTYAANLALNLQKETGKNVIYINISSGSNKGDESGEVHDEVTVNWKNEAVDISNIVGDREKILESVIKDDLKIDLLNVAFNSDDVTLKGAIGAFVSAFVGDYHYVVVDLPNEMDDVVVETLTQADQVHLISSDRKKDLDLIRRVLDRLEITLKERFREERIRVIVRTLHTKNYLSFEEINQCLDYHVYGALPIIQQSELTEKIDTASLRFLLSHRRSEYAKAVRRIARQIGGVSIGIALGGGAALGLAHIGILRVLEKEDIPIDIIVGSSMGALIAGLWAIGKDSRQIEEVAREFERPLSKLKLLDPPIFPISGLLRGKTIRRWLKKHFKGRTFYNVRTPLKVIAYDLVRREELVIDSGSIADAIKKSISIPGVIRPVQNKDQLIIDGGVLNPLPTNVLASLGIKKIIAVNVLQSPKDVSEGFDILQGQMKREEAIPFHKAPFHFLKFRIARALFKPFSPNISDIIIQTLQASEYVISEQNAQQADVLIHPNLVGIKWHQIDRVSELVKRGEEAAQKLLPEIRKLIED